MVTVSRTSAYVGVPERDEGHPAIEKQCVVGLLHVTRLEEIDTRSST
jgi:hypothetical protein